MKHVIEFTDTGAFPSPHIYEWCRRCRVRGYLRLRLTKCKKPDLDKVT